MQLIAKGKKSSTAVLLIHGFMGSLIDWDFLLEILCKKHYCVMLNLGDDSGIAPKWPFSLTRGRTLAEANFKQLLKTIRHFGKEQGIKHWKILGYSLGGRLAALLSPHLGAKILIMESAFFGLKTLQARNERFLQDKTWYIAIEKNWGETLVRNWYHQAVFNGIHEDKKSTDALIKSRLCLAKTQVLEQLVLYSQAFLPAVKMSELTNTNTYLLAGKLDVKYTRLMREWGGKYPQITVKIKDGASHNLHLFNPDWYVEVVTNILV